MDISSFFLLLLTNCLGGASFVATAYALKSFSPFAVVFWRVLIAGPFFLPFCVRALRKTRLNIVDWGRIFLIAAVGYDAPLIFGAWGQKLSSATHAALLMALEPVSIIFLAALFLDEELSALKIFALGVSLIGSFLIVSQGRPLTQLFDFSSSSYLGDGFLCLQGILFALYTVIGKPLLKKIDALSLTALISFLAIFPLLFFAGSAKFVVVRIPISGPALLFTLYLSLGVSFAGVLTWNLAMERVSASLLAYFIFLQPLLGVLFGVFLLREALNWDSLLGGILILLGVYCATLKPQGERSLILK